MPCRPVPLLTPNLHTKLLDFRGCDSSKIFNLRGEILMSTGNNPESLSQRILVGIILVGRLGVLTCALLPFLRTCRAVRPRPLSVSENSSNDDTHNHIMIITINRQHIYIYIYIDI